MNACMLYAQSLILTFFSLSQIALRSYTFENVAFHVLHERLPHFSFQTLTEWYASSDKQLRYAVQFVCVADTMFIPFHMAGFDQGSKPVLKLFTQAWLLVLL